MKTLDIIKTANSNLFRNKLRTFLTIIAIFVGSFTIILNTAINTGVNSFIDKQVSAAGGEGYMEIAPSALMAQVENLMSIGGTPQEYDPATNASTQNFISDETMQKIADIPGIKKDSVKPARMVSVEYVTSPHTDKKYKINVNALSTNTVNIDMVAGTNVNIDSTAYEIAIAPDYATALGFASDEDIIGQTIAIAVKNQVTSDLTEITVKVVGVQAPSVISMGFSWINDAFDNQIHAVSTAGLPDSIANRILFATAEFDPDATTEELQSIKDDLAALNLTGMTVDDQVGMVKTFFDVILIVFTIFGAIALVAASIGIINTLFMSVQERTREIGLMKAMGLSSAKIFLLFSTEAILLGFWGSALGITISIIVGNIGNSIAHETFLVDFPTFNLVEFTPYNLIIITLIIMFIAFLTGTLPARRAAAENPIDALRYE